VSYSADTLHSEFRMNLDRYFIRFFQTVIGAFELKTVIISHVMPFRPSVSMKQSESQCTDFCGFLI